MKNSTMLIRKAYLMLEKYKDEIIDAEPDEDKRKEVYALIDDLEKACDE